MDDLIFISIPHSRKPDAGRSVMQPQFVACITSINPDFPESPQTRIDFTHSSHTVYTHLTIDEVMAFLMKR